jgi:hypothetical protein
VLGQLGQRGAFLSDIRIVGVSNAVVVGWAAKVAEET